MGLTVDIPWKIGSLAKGELNLISDVVGIEVGHCTLKQGKEINTGVTVIQFPKRNIFKDKLIAASEVINGYGKTLGLVQLNELGTLETPIVLTNTLSVGVAHTALVKYMLKQNSDLVSVNPLICECNDSLLNDIRGLHLKEDDVTYALNNTQRDFAEGAVGAGRGMTCLGFKGGIGSSSRVFEIANKTYTLGTLVLTNFGKEGDLRIAGQNVDKRLNDDQKVDVGSCIMISATDAPLSYRQLKRVAKRSMAGMANVGSYFGHGSGDISIAFSTANTINNESRLVIEILNDEELNEIFRADIEAIEEAIISSMMHAETVEGYQDTSLSLRSYLSKEGLI